MRKKLVSLITVISMLCYMFVGTDVYKAYAGEVSPEVLESATLIDVKQGGKKLTGNVITLGEAIETVSEIKLKLIKVDGGLVQELTNVGDTLTIQFDEKLQLARIPQPESIQESGVEIGVLEYKNTPQGAVAVIRFTIDNKSLGDTDKIHSATVNIATVLELIDTVGEGEIIELFGQQYTTKSATNNSYHIEKTGVLVEKGQYVDWTVVVSDKGNGNKSLEGLTFEDEQDESFGELVSFKVNAQQEQPLVNDKTVKYTFTDAHTGEARIEYRVKLSDAFYFNQVEAGHDHHNVHNTYKSREIVNTAKLLGKDNSVIVEDAIALEITTNHIEKYARSNYDGIVDTSDLKRVTWEITFNQHELPLNDVVIADVLPQALQFDKARLSKWNAQTQDWEVVNANIQPVDEWGNYNIGNITEKHKLEIVSVAKSQSAISTIQYFVNEAYLKTSSSAVEVKSSKVGMVGVNIIYKGTWLPNGAALKWENDGLYAYWQIQFNKNNLNLPQDMKVYDVLHYRHIVQGKNRQTINFANVEQGNLPELFKAKTTQLSNVDYQASGQKFVDGSMFTEGGTADMRVIPVVENGVEVGQILEFSNFQTPNEMFIKFKTKILEPKVLFSNTHGPRGLEKMLENEVYNAAFLTDSNNELINHASSVHNNKSGQIYKETLEASAVEAGNGIYSQFINAVVVTKEEGKTTGVNRKDNSIYYRLSVNSSGENLSKTKFYDGATHTEKEFGKFTVTDVLPKGWEFVEIEPHKKVKVFAGDVDKASLRAVVSDFTPVEDTTVDVEFKSTSEVDIKFVADLDKPYVILLKAQPTAQIMSDYIDEKVIDGVAYKKIGTLGDVAEITNNVKLHSESWTEGVAQLASSYIKKDVLEKTSKYIGGGSILWTVDYKPMGADFSLPNGDAPKIVDTIPRGVSLPIGDSGELVTGNGFLEIVELNISADGREALGQPVQDVLQYVNYATDTRELSFTVPDKTKSYRMTYSTDAEAPVGQISNSVRIVGNDSTPKLPVVAQFSVDSVHVSATLDRLGVLKLVKTNEDKTERLSGAKFGLFTMAHKKLREVETTAEGKAEFVGLYAGKYYVKELEAPNGYKLPDVNSFEITIKRDTGTGKMVTLLGTQQLKNNTMEVENSLLPQQPPKPPQNNGNGNGNGGGGGANPQPQQPNNPQGDNGTSQTPSVPRSDVRPDNTKPQKPKSTESEHSKEQSKQEQPVQEQELNSKEEQDVKITGDNTTVKGKRNPNDELLGESGVPVGGLDKDKRREKGKVQSINKVPKTGYVGGIGLYEVAFALTGVVTSCMVYKKKKEQE